MRDSHFKFNQINNTYMELDNPNTSSLNTNVANLTTNVNNGNSLEKTAHWNDQHFTNPKTNRSAAPGLMAVNYNPVGISLWHLIEYQLIPSTETLVLSELIPTNPEHTLPCPICGPFQKPFLHRLIRQYDIQ